MSKRGDGRMTVWIPIDAGAHPCERDMPSEHEWVLVTDMRFATPKKAKYHSDLDMFEYDSKSASVEYVVDGRVVAWMKMPGVYRG